MNTQLNQKVKIMCYISIFEITSLKKYYIKKLNLQDVR